jgi:hypothetical protein
VPNLLARQSSWDLNGTISIIVSHSGGTFAPLAVSNLLQVCPPAPPAPALATLCRHAAAGICARVPGPVSGRGFVFALWSCARPFIAASSEAVPAVRARRVQGFTHNIFVVASEWDTQIGKQLRQMYAGAAFEIKSFIFTTFVPPLPLPLPLPLPPVLTGHVSSLPPY